MANRNLPQAHDNNELKSDKPKLKIFKMSQKYFAILGISPILVTQPYPFNRNISINYLLFGLHLICHFIFVLYEATTLWEYIQSIYLCSISILGAMVFSMLVFRVSILFKYIAEFETVINIGKRSLNISNFNKQSIKFTRKLFTLALVYYPKSEALIIKTNRLTDEISETVYCLIAIATPLFCVLLRPIFVYFIYFTTDLKNDAFQLPAPTW